MISEQQVFDEIHSALCGNGLTNEVANFLADLAIRVRRLENVPPCDPPKGPPND